MARKTPKLVVADKRAWAKNFFREYPQAAKKTNEHSFEVLAIHNAIDFEIGENLSPSQLENLIHAGWQVDVRAVKE